MRWMFRIPFFIFPFRYLARKLLVCFFPKTYSCSHDCSGREQESSTSGSVTAEGCAGDGRACVIVLLAGRNARRRATLNKIVKAVNVIFPAFWLK